MFLSIASLAQSVERETLNLKVAGSTPAWGFMRNFFFCLNWCLVCFQDQEEDDEVRCFSFLFLSLSCDHGFLLFCREGSLYST